MRNVFFAAIAALATGFVLSSPVQAGGFAPVLKDASPTFMLGIAVELGDTVNEADVGITSKIVSSNRPDQFIVGAGVSYFPWAEKQFGLDLGAGYNFSSFAALASYDILRWKPQFSAGYVPTDKDYECPPDNPYYYGPDYGCGSVPPPP